MPYLTPEAILEGFQHYNEVMRSVAAEENTLLIGDEDSIPADAVHYRDSAHFTDAEAWHREACCRCSYEFAAPPGAGCGALAFGDRGCRPAPVTCGPWR